MNYLELAKKFVKKSHFGNIMVSIFPKSWLYTNTYSETQRPRSMDKSLKNDELQLEFTERRAVA